MPWISKTFKEDYLDDYSNRNAILRYNYEDLFIMKIGFGLTYKDATQSLRANVETAGNILKFMAPMTGMERNEDGQYKLFNIAFAQNSISTIQRLSSLILRTELYCTAELASLIPTATATSFLSRKDTSLEEPTPLEDGA